MALNPTAPHIPILTPAAAKLAIMKQAKQNLESKVLFNLTFTTRSLKQEFMYLPFLYSFNMSSNNLMVVTISSHIRYLI